MAKKKHQRRSKRHIKQRNGPEWLSRTQTLPPRKFTLSSDLAIEAVLEHRHTDSQSGDMQGLAVQAIADSQSVEELVAEGQYLEAEIVKGIEATPDPDEAKIVPHGRKRLFEYPT